MAITFTGIAVLGVLAGSLSSLYNLDTSAADATESPEAAGDSAVASVPAELAMLRAQLQAVEHRLGELAALVSAGRGGDP